MFKKLIFRIHGKLLLEKGYFPRSSIRLCCTLQEVLFQGCHILCINTYQISAYGTEVREDDCLPGCVIIRGEVNSNMVNFIARLVILYNCRLELKGPCNWCKYRKNIMPRYSKQ